MIEGFRSEFFAEIFTENAKNYILQSMKIV